MRCIKTMCTRSHARRIAARPFGVVLYSTCVEIALLATVREGVREGSRRKAQRAHKRPKVRAAAAEPEQGGREGGRPTGLHNHTSAHRRGDHRGAQERTFSASTPRGHEVGRECSPRSSSSTLPRHRPSAHGMTQTAAWTTSTSAWTAQIVHRRAPMRPTTAVRATAGGHRAHGIGQCALGSAVAGEATIAAEQTVGMNGLTLGPAPARTPH